LQNLKSIVISERLRDSIDILLDDIPKGTYCCKEREFRELTAPFIQWHKQPSISLLEQINKEF
jgi:hypothetical protein